MFCDGIINVEGEGGERGAHRQHHKDRQHRSGEMQNVRSLHDAQSQQGRFTNTERYDSRAKLLQIITIWALLINAKGVETTAVTW